MAGDRNESPKERAPLLLVFGDLASRVAALVRAQPILIARVIVAPPEAIHAIAAFLYLAPDAAKPDLEVAALLNEADPRELLRAALPGCPPRLYRSLARAGNHVHARSFYKELGRVCTEPFADALLDGELTDNRITFYKALAKMDPAMAALRSGLPESAYLCEGVDCLLALLRARGALRDEDVRLPPRAGMPAVARRLRTALGRIEAPEPIFTVPAPFSFVRTTDELYQIGRSFGNCVAFPQWNAARYHLGLIDGTAVFLTSDEPPLLAVLHRVAQNVYYFEQCKGPKNASPPPGMRSALIRDLTAAGLRIVTTDPQSAWGRLEQEARRNRSADGTEVDFDDEGEDEDEDEDEDDDEIAA